MTQKPFGVKQLNVIGAAGTPTIESAGDLNIGGQQVAITTNTSIAGVITATSFFGDGSGLTGVTGSGSGVVIQEEGSSVGTADTINFIGAGVTATLSGGIASVEITSTGGGIDGISTTGTSFFNQLNISGVTTHQGDIYLGDSDVLRFGTGSGGFGDLQIWHDSFHSYVRDNGTGNLRLKTNNLIELVSGGTDEVMGQFASDAGVGLYYNGQKKFETTNGGAVVTGILTATSFSGDGSALTNISASVPANLTATTLNVSGVTTAANFRTNSTTGDGSDVGFAIKYYVTSNGSSSYRFAGPGLINTTDNPTLYLHRGFTYIFENSTGGGHPFRIQFTGTTTGVGTYVSGSQSGTQVFTIPFDAPSSYEYQCTLHGGMKGTLAIPT